MKKRLLELQENREAKRLEVRELLDLAKKEDRSFTDQEETRFSELETEIENFDAEIESVEKQIERSKKYAEVRHKNTKKSEIEDIRGTYSIANAFKQVLKRGYVYEGVEKEMHEEAEKVNKNIEGFGIPSMLFERTTLTSGTAATAGDLVANELSQNLISSLQPNPVMAQLGATYLTGLQGDLDLPIETAASDVTWEGEVDADAESNPTYDLVQLSPNRVAATTKISKTLLAQQSIIADTELANLLRRSTERAIDTQAINGTGSPITGITGFSNVGSVAGGTNGAVPSWPNIVGLESEIFSENAQTENMYYLTTPAMRGALKTVSKDSGSGQFLMMGDMANGYPVAVSTLVPSDLDKGSSTGVCHAIIFGNFADLIIGNWGNGYDIVVDPYSSKRNAIVEVTVNSWWDIKPRHEESFAVMLDALTS